MHHIPLVIAMLTASQPTGTTIPPSYLQICFAMENHHHGTCGLIRQDWNETIEFSVERSAFEEFMALPWLMEEFPNVTVEAIDVGQYHDRLARSTFGGFFFDFRGARHGDVQLTSWGDVAHDGPTSFEIRAHEQTISTNGGLPQTPRMFVDSRLTAGDEECTVAILGGFMKGAATYGVAGAGGGATLGALVGGLGAGPGAVAGSVLLGAWGAVAGSLEAAADHCYGGNDKQEKDDKEKAEKEKEEKEEKEKEEKDEGGSDDSGDDSGGDDSGGDDTGDEKPTGGETEPQDGTPNPDDVAPSEDAEEAIGMLGLGGRPYLSPTSDIDSLLGDRNPKRHANVRVTRPMQLPRDWEILHDNDWTDWLPVDMDEFYEGSPIAPKDPPPRWRSR